ncbi:MAG: DUF2306 domain-containing protein [Oceanicaulis sp.]|nr:DUF2306 domain-containing protein [Oceanicaulis sp.]
MPSDTAVSPSASARALDRLLGASGALWFLCAAAGQLMFAAYLVVLYGGGVARGDASVWNRVLGQGYMPGDTAGNAALAAHVLLAIVIMLGGLIQLTPQIRAAVPAFHRWNGRVYLTLAVVITLAGLWLTWARPPAGGLLNDLAITLNGVLILGCALFAVRNAMARRIDRHMRWATRLFLVVSGVWFLRIMISGWIAWHQAPLWLGAHLAGPLGVPLPFAAPRAWPKAVMTGVMAMLAALTAFGGYAASQIMWLPHMG